MFKLKSLRLTILTLLFPLTLFGAEMTVVAHRGNSSEAPENTYAAFRSAADNNFPFIEFDVHLTKDGVPVVVHDHYLIRTSDNRFPIAINDMTLSQVKYLDCGKWFDTSFKGEQMLTLRELLEAPLKDIGLMVEIKEGSASDEKLALAVLEEVTGYLNSEGDRPILIGSKSPYIVRLIKENAPGLPTIGIAEDREDLLEHQHNEPDYIALYKEIVTEPVVRQLHHKGKKVWVWTVDTPEEMDYIKQCNVDGVITNFPRLMSTLNY